MDRQENAPVQPGDSVEVSGRVEPGLFAKVFLSSKTTVLEHPGLPEAQPATYREMQTGTYDSRFVEMSGTIHAARLEEVWGRRMLLLDLDTGDGFVTAYLMNYPSGDPGFLVDSEVRVKGVCGTIFNNRRQLLGLRLFVPGFNQINVVVPGVKPDAVPVSDMNSLLTLQGPSLRHRVHVKGTVTYQSAESVFLQDKGVAVRVLNPAGDHAAVGERAEAWGFIAEDGYSPALENGFVRATGPATPLAPLQVRASDLIRLENGFMQAPYDGLLVELKAKIADRIPNSGSLIWSLKANGVDFQAQLGGAPRKWALGFESGTEVTLTGICVTEADSGKKLKSFHILLRSPEDMRLVKSPPGHQSLWLMLAGYLAVTGAALLAFLGLRRRGSALTSSAAGESDASTVRICLRISKVLALTGTLVALGLVPSAAAGGKTPVLTVLALGASGAALLLQHRNRAYMVEFLRVSLLAFAVSVGYVELATNQAATVIALSLVVLGLAGISAKLRKFEGAGQVMTAMTVFTALLKLVGSIYGVEVLNGMAVHLLISTPQAVILLALSIATLLSNPEQGTMRTFCSVRLGGVMLRRLIPAAILVPVVVGWVRLQLQVYGLIDTRVGVTMFALSNALVFSFIMWCGALILNRLDAAQSETAAALQEREHKLKLLFDSGKMGDFTWDVATDRLTAHPSVWRMYGETESHEFEPASWFSQRQHPDDAARIANEVEAAFRTGQTLDLTFRVIWPNNTIRWVHCRAVARLNAEGKPVQTSGINLDVTENVQAVQKLRESALLFEELQDAMPQIVWMADRAGYLYHYNRGWYEYTGLALDSGWETIVPSGDLPAIQAAWMKAVTEGAAVYENEVRLKRAKDGAYRWHLVRAISVRDNNGEIQRWFGTCTDVDDFKRASQELATLNETLEQRVEERSRELVETERRFRLLVESVKEYAIYMLDGEGRVISWNAGAERLKGYSSEEVIGKSMSMFYAPDDPSYSNLQGALHLTATEGRFHRESLHLRKDGSQFWASELISPAYDTSGKLVGFSKIVRDLTEWQRARDVMASAQKRAEEANLAKSRFLAAMSHEIRTPMNAILGMADLLWETMLDSTQREYVGRFRRAGANLLALINDILDLSKIESGVFELEMIDFDLLELVDRVMELTQPRAVQKNIKLETEMLPGLQEFLVGDPVRLQQVLNNLIGNAIKFTPAGTVALRIGPHADGQPGHLQFAVKDTGIGIPADKLDSIFSDFTQAESSTTRRFGGTGLGLGICRRLVQKMGGTLSVESQVGKGSTFEFDVFLDVSAGGSLSPGATIYSLSGLRVLVVDDNPTNRMILCHMCQSWGMQTFVAATAEQATALVREAGDSGQGFGLILLDRVLPGATGFELLAEIRRMDPNAQVIVTSSDNQSGDLTEARALGAAAYLMKPVRRSELLSCMTAAISSGQRAELEPAAKFEEPASPKRMKVLLAEDSEDNRFLVEAYLEDRPYELTLVENGREAVNAFMTDSFDVILMDVQMPVMDGLAATIRIRELEREMGRRPTIIVALTANALVEDSNLSYAAGCNAHLPKPISRDKLLAALEGFREGAASGYALGELTPVA